MPDSATIGAGFRDYQGNATLGGGFLPPITIDTQPLQKLAEYTMMYNKSLFDQKQKNADAMILELSKMSDINMNDLIRKDKDELSKEWIEFQKSSSDWLRNVPITPEEKLKSTLEFQSKFSKINNKYLSGKQRALAYHTQSNAILEKYKDPKSQEAALKKLDETFDKSSIETKLDALPIFDIEAPVLPAPLTSVANMVDIGGNENLAVGITYFDPNTNTNEASRTALGLLKLNIPKTIKDGAGKEMPNPEYEKLSDREKYYQSLQATVDGQAEVWAKMEEPINAVLNQYISNGVFDEVRFKKEQASNGTVQPVIQAFEEMKAYAENKKAQAAQGIFTSDTGDQFKLPDNLKPEDFDKMIVDYKSGKVTADNLVLAGMFKQYGADVVTPKLTETQNELQMAQIKAANYRAKLEQNGANYRANLPYEKLKKTAEDANDAAKKFGNIIYGINSSDVQGSFALGKSLKMVDGAIVNDEGAIQSDVTGEFKVPAAGVNNTIVTEFNKYAGTAKVDSYGNVISATAPSKINVDKGIVKIRIENGVVSGVMTDDGTYAGVDQFQYITTFTSQKGVTKYKQPEDISGGATPTPQSLTPAQKAFNLKHFGNENGKKK